jgi:Polyketide cyclase / dehydrase and lipid transport
MSATTPPVSLFSKILSAVGSAILIFLVIVSFQPNEFRVMRSLAMNAPAERVFAQVNVLKNWDAWSPWAKIDPEMKTGFEGREAGPGAEMSWEGNSDVGKGEMEITDSRPHEFIRLKLTFLEPMESTQTAEFTFEETAGKTRVTWTMYGSNNFLGKAVGLIFNCKKMVGEQFEKGLASLKKVAEATD